MRTDLVDRIYEAAFLPDMWVETLDAIGEATGSRSGAVVVYPPNQRPRGRATELTRASFEYYCATDDWQTADRATTNLDARAAGFLCDVDYLTPEQLESDSVTKALAPLGLGWQVASFVRLPGQEFVWFTFERWLAEGRHDIDAMELLAHLRPHLARSGLLAARLGMERATAAVSALEAIGLPAAVLRQDGRVIASNGLLDGLQATIIPVAGGGLAIDHPAANAALRDCLQRLAAGGAPAVQSIPVPARAERDPMVVHLVPIRRSARDIMTGAEVLLAVTKIGQHAVPDHAILAGLFDLTPAETRVSTNILKGQTVDQIAGQLSVSVATVRSHLRAIFEKTGTTRQAELVALVSNINLPE